MQFSLLAGLSAIVGLTVAAPAATDSSGPSCKSFMLKTTAVPGQKHPQFDGLYVQSYHTGAGENDLVLQTEPGFTAMLNDSQIVTHLSEPSTDWAWDMPIDNNYAGWSSTTLNLGSPDANYSQFSFNASGLQFSDSPSQPAANIFAGWLACQWWHGVPQLFYLINGFNDPLPDTCSKVQIHPVC